MAWGWGATGKLQGDDMARACEGKTAYPSESSARAGLRFFQDEGVLRTNDGMEVYRCKFCLEWHFGH